MAFSLFIIACCIFYLKKKAEKSSRGQLREAQSTDAGLTQQLG